VNKIETKKEEYERGYSSISNKRIKEAIEMIETRLSSYSMSSDDYIDLIVLELREYNLRFLDYLKIMRVAWAGDEDLVDLLSTLEDVLTASRFLVEK